MTRPRVPKGHVESGPLKKVMLVYCSTCHKYRVGSITKMRRKEGREPIINIDIICCTVCETVQNMDRIPKTKWITYKELKIIEPECIMYKKYEHKNKLQKTTKNSIRSR